LFDAIDFSGSGDGHIQSLIFSSILIGIGFQTMMAAFLADLLSVNRRLLEELQYKSRSVDKRPSPGGNETGGEG
jgi:hypothetical protein